MFVCTLSVFLPSLFNSRSVKLESLQGTVLLCAVGLADSRVVAMVRKC